MSISYSGIVNYGKVMLPSVESWGSNNNILKDPPRSITTRRIDKVTDTVMIDQEIQESVDRVAESIRVYPRGANVMVGVSYDNFGSNGGNRIGQTLLYNGQQSKLPYRVAKDGEFRPPILTPVNLLPLSRLPRNNVTVDPVAYTADFTKKLVCPGTAKDYRSVKDDTIQFQTEAPRAQYIRKVNEIGVSQNVHDPLRISGDTLKTQKISTPVEVGVSQNIQDVLKVSGDTLRTQKISTPVEIGVAENIRDTLKSEIYSNKRVPDRGNNSTKYTNDSIREQAIHYSAQSNVSQNINKNPVQSKIIYHPNAKRVVSANSNVKGAAVKYNLHETQELKDKPILRGEISVNNFHRGVYSPHSQQPTSRDVYLMKKGHIGMMEGAPSIPSINRSCGEVKLKGRGFYDLMNKKIIYNK